MTAIRNLFKRQLADDIRAELLQEAERLHVEHQATAELHAGLAAVYKMRADRLRAELAPRPAVRAVK